jgi:hypothetical protein
LLSIFVDCETLNENKFFTRPNPSTTDFFVTYYNETAIKSADMHIKDIKGVMVKSKRFDIESGANNVMIDGADLNPGVYFITIETPEFKGKVVRHVIH